MNKNSFVCFLIFLIFAVNITACSNQSKGIKVESSAETQWEDKFVNWNG